MNRKKRTCNVLWLQLLGAEFEDDKASSSEEEDNIILQTVLIQRLNTQYLKSQIYHVAKSKDWWQNTLSLYDLTRFNN